MEHFSKALYAGALTLATGGAAKTTLKGTVALLEPVDEVVVRITLEDIGEIEVGNDLQCISRLHRCVEELRFELSVTVAPNSSKNSDGSENMCGLIAMYQAWKGCLGTSFPDAVALGQAGSARRVTNNDLAKFLRDQVTRMGDTSSHRAYAESVITWLLNPANKGRLLPLAMRAHTDFLCFPDYDRGFRMTVFGMEDNGYAGLVSSDVHFSTRGYSGDEAADILQNSSIILCTNYRPGADTGNHFCYLAGPRATTSTAVALATRRLASDLLPFLKGLAPRELRSVQDFHHREAVLEMAAQSYTAEYFIVTGLPRRAGEDPDFLMAEGRAIGHTAGEIDESFTPLELNVRFDSTATAFIYKLKNPVDINVSDLDSASRFRMRRGQQNRKFIVKERDSAGEGATTTLTYMLTYITAAEIPGALGQGTLAAVRGISTNSDTAGCAARVVSDFLGIPAVTIACEFVHAFVSLDKKKRHYHRACYLVILPLDPCFDIRSAQEEWDSPAAGAQGLLCTHLGMRFELFRSMQSLVNTKPYKNGAHVLDATLLLLDKCPLRATLGDIFEGTGQVVGPDHIATIFKTQRPRQYMLGLTTPMAQLDTQSILYPGLMINGVKPIVSICDSHPGMREAANMAVLAHTHKMVYPQFRTDEVMERITGPLGSHSFRKGSRSRSTLRYAWRRIDAHSKEAGGRTPRPRHRNQGRERRRRSPWRPSDLRGMSRQGRMLLYRRT